MKFIQKFYDYMAKDMESSIKVCVFKPLSAKLFFFHAQVFFQIY
jgi:hypothetical protein